MPRYIDADKAKHEFNIGFGGVSHAVIANQIIDSIPTADVVEVVRCKDCKYAEENECIITGTKSLFCLYKVNVVSVEPTHYCAYGERKEK